MELAHELAELDVVRGVPREFLGDLLVEEERVLNEISCLREDIDPRE